MTRRTKEELEAENLLLLSQLETIRDHLDDLLEDAADSEEALSERSDNDQGSDEADHGK